MASSRLQLSGQQQQKQRVRALSAHSPSLTPAAAAPQVRVLLHGSQTLLGDAASAHELFLTERTRVAPLDEVRGALNAAPPC